MVLGAMLMLWSQVGLSRESESSPTEQAASAEAVNPTETVALTREVVVVVDLSADSSSALLPLVQQLVLVLDGWHVRTIEEDTEGFAKMSLAEKLARLTKESLSPDMLIWQESEGDTPHLYLLPIGEAGAPTEGDIREVHGDSADELALAVHELVLNDFEPEPETPAEPAPEVVETREVERQVMDTEKPWPMPVEIAPKFRKDLYPGVNVAGGTGVWGSDTILLPLRPAGRAGLRPVFHDAPAA